MPADITILILTKNEEDNLPKTLASVRAFAKRVVVVDSGSTDRTIEIARAAGADVYEHPWRNYAEQLNWGLASTGIDTTWTFRLDADEEVLPELASWIAAHLGAVASDVDGVEVCRRMYFLGRWIRHGGMYPRHHVRIFRSGRVTCELALMDEHMVVRGRVVRADGDIKDDNTKPLRWWIAKHNWYSDREAFDLLEREAASRMPGLVEPRLFGSHAERIRWFKTKVYARVPSAWRSRLYFLWRYYLQLGFLDGEEGRIYHFLHAHWYRFLCDAKVMEARKFPKVREELVREVYKSLG
jgi:glycosyltransferase involved in cell wall biosynthesis